MPQSFVKDPDAEIDYEIDWSEWLDADEEIVTSTWDAPAALTADNSTNTTTSTTVWLAGGAAGVTYKVTNRIVTTSGRTDERSIRIKVQER